MASITTSSGRRYPFVDSGVSVRIEGDAGSYLRHLEASFPREFARALKSAGWALRKDLQNDIYRGGPSEARWSPLSSIQSRRIIDDHKGHPRVPRTHPMGQLVRAIGYRFDASTQSVRVGWLSHSAAQRGAELQAGFKTRVTKKMRRFFWAIGLHPGPVGSLIETPARDLFDTVIRNRERAIHKYIEDKVHAAVRGSGRWAWAA